jgi:protein phosphatase PTC7
LPHPSKAKTGGEDAFFVSETGCGALGVADGVGSWSVEGIDPAAYAIGLMHAAQQALEESRGKRSALDALDFAQVGYFHIDCYFFVLKNIPEHPAGIKWVHGVSAS